MTGADTHCTLTLCQVLPGFTSGIGFSCHNGLFTLRPWRSGKLRVLCAAMELGLRPQPIHSAIVHCCIWLKSALL